MAGQGQQYITNGFYDGNLLVPVEIEGSGEIQTDAVTLAQVLTRKYVQLKSTYLPPQFRVPFPDLIFSQSYFVSEHVDKIVNGLVFFHRIFCSKPPTRVESRFISFTFPGRSSNAGTLSWNAYGGAAPKTKPVVADVLYDYIIQLNPAEAPIASFTPAVKESVITFGGNPVDFVGDVYALSSTGPKFLPGNKAQQQWVRQGTTNPDPQGLFSITPWIVSVDVHRYMGPVWERAIVQFTTGIPQFT